MESLDYIVSQRNTLSSFNGATDFHPWKEPIRTTTLRFGVGFNGATEFHPWKDRFGGLMIELSKGFNGATDFHPWKVRLTALIPDTLTRFNGATDFHPWKEGTKKAKAYPFLASMGPRTFIRGKHIIPFLKKVIMGGFNGATDFHPWKDNGISFDWP